MQTLALVEQLIARLEGFVAGRETNESLQRWAHEVDDGRHFALECAIEVPERVSVVYCERRGDAAECLIDVLETLGLDRDDVSRLCDEFAAVELPRWTLWRQDDNGQRANMASFSGRRKAERRQAELEALGHKQTYWVELG